jgi:hypothetical protein
MNLAQREAQRNAGNASKTNASAPEGRNEIHLHTFNTARSIRCFDDRPDSGMISANVRCSSRPSGTAADLGAFPQRSVRSGGLHAGLNSHPPSGRLSSLRPGRGGTNLAQRGAQRNAGNTTAIKSPSPRRVGANPSTPHIPQIVFHAVLLQNRLEFRLKIALPMMFLLPRDVPDRSLNLRMAD